MELIEPKESIELFIFDSWTDEHYGSSLVLYGLLPK